MTLCVADAADVGVLIFVVIRGNIRVYLNRVLCSGPAFGEKCQDRGILSCGNEWSVGFDSAWWIGLYVIGLPRIFMFSSMRMGRVSWCQALYLPGLG